MQNGTLVSTTIADTQGPLDTNTDLGPPCFASGTKISTAQGDRAIEDPIDGDLIFQEPGETKTYYHMLFDQHEIVLSECVPSESFFPGDTIFLQDKGIRRELCELFPGLATGAPAGYLQPARPSVGKRDAMVLLSAA